MSSTPTSLGANQRRVQTMVRSWSGQGTIEINVAIVGSLGVGKSALTVKYITRRFISEYDPDLEDTYCKNETIDQKDVIVKIMDTCDKPGKEPERYLNWADAFLIVYSVTNRSSFEVAHNYLEGIAQHQRLSTSWDTPTILVGNKVDMERYRQVSKAEGNALATHYDSAFFESTASEEYDSVARIFHEVIREVLREHERCMPLRPLFISEERPGFGPRTVGGVRPHVTFRKDQNLQEKNSRFKFFNKGKGFKAIFQSTT